MGDSVNYEQARKLVLERLKRWIQALPPAERDLPSIVVGDQVLSPLELLQHVEKDTPIGRQYVLAEMKKLAMYQSMM